MNESETRLIQPKLFLGFLGGWRLLLVGSLFPLAPWAFANENLSFPAIPGVSFVSIEDETVPWKAWGEHEASGFSFMYDLVGDSSSPQNLIVLFPGDPSVPCFLEPALREAVPKTGSAILVQPLIESEDRMVCGKEDSLLEVCRSFERAFDIPPERVILVGEKARTQTILNLATNHRADFGGVMAWEGDPGAALPANLVNTSIAILGDRKSLDSFQLFLDDCKTAGVPVRINSYWGQVEEFELANDLREVLDWMSRPESRTIGRNISHAAYIPRYGSYGWIRITHLTEPGLPGRVEGHWTTTALVDLKAEGVRKFRVRLDSTFDRYGKQVFFSVGKLNLPVTLKRDMEGVEFQYFPDKDRWTARFVSFQEPEPLTILSPTIEADFKQGEKIPGFASFLRLETGAKCAWGFRFPSSIPNGELTDENLYCLVPPIPIVQLNWTYAEIEAFHQWQASQVEFGFENSFPPGVRSNAEENPDTRISVALPLSFLEAYCHSRFEPLPDSLESIDNLQHLLGIYLSREHLSSNASL
ncbi:MAG: hypothetical protein KC944_02340 [Candidatus Omnitrophica bacterium]|nr:hypothetical protein [Candidatus Omnitrophota bacterium]MCB9768797.1 hypothetical protein [Candidatus Omnitrophota bacterium]